MLNSGSFTEQVTQTTGPNGAIDWMNCGVNGGGWTPPFVHVTDLITVDLNVAISQGGPFTACSSFVWAFVQFGNQYGRKFPFLRCHYNIKLTADRSSASSSHPLGCDRPPGE